MTRIPRPGKYHAKKKEIDGIIFASGAEARRDMDLKLMEKAEVISNLKVHPKYILIPKPNQITWEADFEYMDVDTGKIVVEDVKGFATKDFRIKAKLFRHFRPEIVLKIVSARGV